MNPMLPLPRDRAVENEVARSAMEGRFVRHLAAQLAGTPIPPPRSCQWPEGDPGTSVFRFCGTALEPGRVYCGAHCQRAYTRLGGAS